MSQNVDERDEYDVSDECGLSLIPPAEKKPDQIVNETRTPSQTKQNHLIVITG
jgi:hypothetical protein